jgi:hypothetical protein
MIRSRTARSSGPGGNKAPFRQDVFQSSIMLYATKEPGAVASMSLRFIISNLYINIASMPYESPSAATIGQVLPKRRGKSGTSKIQTLHSERTRAVA